MSVGTSVSLLVIGGLLALALRRQPPFVDTQVAGMILIATGAAGLWPRGGPRLVRHASVRLREVLKELPPVAGTRVPLDHLFAETFEAPHVWTPYGGHSSYDDVAISGQSAPGDRAPADRR